ncbi:MAG: alpha/beta hydrolase [Holophaga sp.]|nr:alpha/beta hydrolase [Holophaga sp.]
MIERAFPALLLGAALLAEAPAPPAMAITRIEQGSRSVVLIPGLGCGGGVWDRTVEAMKGEATFHVCTLAGFDGQPPLPAPQKLIPAAVEALAAYIEKEKLQKVLVVGHSLGGFVAMKLAQTYPERVNGLVIVDAYTTLEAAKAQALATGKTSFAAMPTAELVLVENSRHFIMADQPAVWLAALRDALRQSQV